jgi:hypothetical protein
VKHPVPVVWSCAAAYRLLAERVGVAMCEFVAPPYVARHGGRRRAHADEWSATLPPRRNRDVYALV